MDDIWYRNTSWSEEIANAFEQKLQRARCKEQYLRIQASTLADKEPEVALHLLERYFALPDDFDDAQAHVDRATALLALDRLSEALCALEAALTREAEFPRLQTEAYLMLPYLIATEKVQSAYPRALEVLEQYQDRLLFPVDHFKWHASYALIYAADKPEVAAKYARTALEVAEVESSGLRYHPNVGLVNKEHNEVLGQLERLLQNAG